MGWAADTEADLLRLARQGNQAAVQSIRTLQCKFRNVVTKPRPDGDEKWYYSDLDRGREWSYWRSGQTFRQTEPRDDGEHLLVMRNGQNLTIVRYPWYKNPPLSRSETGFYKEFGQAYYWLMFCHEGGDCNHFYSFDQLFDQPTRAVSARREGDDIRVRLSLAKAECLIHEFLLSPKHNYLVRRWRAYGQSELLYEHEVLEFAEADSGVFLPTVIEHRALRDGETKMVMQTRLTEYAVNKPIPPETFRLPNTKGMVCYDRLRGTQYTVDEDGNRVGEETPWQPGIAVTEATDPVKHAEERANRANRPELIDPPATPVAVTSDVWWYTGGAVLVVAALTGVAVSAYRRKRSPT